MTLSCRVNLELNNYHSENAEHSINRHDPGLSPSDAIAAVFLQAAGPVSSLLVVVFIARAHGVEAQGQFAALRVWLDLMMVVFAFGLSTSFTYAINRLGTPGPQLARAATSYAVIVTVLCSLLLWALHIFGLLNFTVTNIDVLFFLGVACGMGVLADLWRGVLLSKTDGPVYSVSVTLQPVFLLALCIAAAYQLSVVRLDVYLALANLLAVIVTGIFLVLQFKRHPIDYRSTGKHKSLPLKPIVNFGFHSFQQNIGITLVPLASLWLIEYQGGTQETIGLWSVAALVFQAIASPVAMIAPLLFNRWSKSDHALSVAHARSLTVTLLKWSIVPTVAGALATYYLVPSIFGADFQPAALAAAAMVFCMPPLLVSRVFAPAIFAVGQARFLTILFWVRLLIIIGTGVLFQLAGVAVLLGLSASWVLAEMVLAGLSWRWSTRL